MNDCNYSILDCNITINKHPFEKCVIMSTVKIIEKFSNHTNIDEKGRDNSGFC
jgi:hypothetical protein